LQKLLLPVDTPRYLDLNSYYMDVPKFIGHFRENNFTGCIHFRSHQAEAVLYYDQDEILNTLFTDQKGSESGDEAISALINSTKQVNYLISIYDIHPKKIYFWANLTIADPLYKDLNAEFTDLEGLIKKMASEKLIGYIEVVLPGNQGGFILFHGGTVMSKTYNWENDVLVPTSHGLDTLVRKSRESGGTFHVKRVAPETQQNREQIVLNTLAMIEDLLQITEEVIGSNRKFRGKFDTLLRKKFLDKSERFGCLDPFLCEFQYENRKASFDGNAAPGELARGVFEAVAELGVELGLTKQLGTRLTPWAAKNSRKINSIGVPYFQGLIQSG
jgi:hypothetical protein